MEGLYLIKDALHLLGAVRECLDGFNGHEKKVAHLQRRIAAAEKLLQALAQLSGSEAFRENMHYLEHVQQRLSAATGSAAELIQSCRFSNNSQRIWNVIRSAVGDTKRQFEDIHAAVQESLDDLQRIMQAVSMLSHAATAAELMSRLGEQRKQEDNVWREAVSADTSRGNELLKQVLDNQEQQKSLQVNIMDGIRAGVLSQQSIETVLSSIKEQNKDLASRLEDVLGASRASLDVFQNKDVAGFWTSHVRQGSMKSEDLVDLVTRYCGITAPTADQKWVLKTLLDVNGSGEVNIVEFRQMFDKPTPMNTTCQRIFDDIVKQKVTTDREEYVVGRELTAIWCNVPSPLFSFSDLLIVLRPVGDLGDGIARAPHVPLRDSHDPRDSNGRRGLCRLTIPSGCITGAPYEVALMRGTKTVATSSPFLVIDDENTDVTSLTAGPAIPPFFICCHPDDRSFVSSIRRTLVDAEVQCGTDYSKLTGKDRWTNPIAQQIRMCGAFVFCGTRQSLSSQYLRMEVDFAEKKLKTILCVWPSDPRALNLDQRQAEFRDFLLRFHPSVHFSGLTVEINKEAKLKMLEYVDLQRQRVQPTVDRFAIGVAEAVAKRRFSRTPDADKDSASSSINEGERQLVRKDLQKPKDHLIKKHDGAVRGALFAAHKTILIPDPAQARSPQHSSFSSTSLDEHGDFSVASSIAEEAPPQKDKDKDKDKGLFNRLKVGPFGSHPSNKGIKKLNIGTDPQYVRKPSFVGSDPSSPAAPGASPVVSPPGSSGNGSAFPFDSGDMLPSPYNTPPSPKIVGGVPASHSPDLVQWDIDNANPAGSYRLSGPSKRPDPRAFVCLSSDWSTVAVTPLLTSGVTTLTLKLERVSGSSPMLIGIVPYTSALPPSLLKAPDALFVNCSTGAKGWNEPGKATKIDGMVKDGQIKSGESLVLKIDLDRRELSVSLGSQSVPSSPAFVGLAKRPYQVCVSCRRVDDKVKITYYNGAKLA